MRTEITIKKLPRWVIDRAVKAYGDQYQSSEDGLESCIHAALQEFLKIIEERAGEDWVIDGRSMLANEDIHTLLSDDHI